MRLTVGPLPPAVYWRRRVVVLGAGLLFLVVVLYSCSGPGRSGARPEATTSGTPSATAASGEPVLTPETGTPPAGGEESTFPPAEGEDSSDGGTVPAAPAPGEGACADEEMSVIPVPSQTSTKVGVTIELRIKIKNVSNRTCSRDVGADLQELYIRVGAEKIWSSDTCGTAKGSDVQSFPPRQENEYRVAWNGRKTTRCASGVANGPYPDAGEYQLFGRLGTKLSEPVKLTITN